MVVSIPRGLLERLGEELVGALSERETEIVLLTAHGHSNYQIGREPSLSEATVKRHLAIIYSKIGVRSRSSGSTLTTSPPPTQMARAPDSGCYSPKCLEEVFSEVRAAALRVAS
jgi:DNA-binding CsgD family transcriptional regulator